MTTLRDPFAVIHKKEIKNKAGEVVARVDYIGWSQSADRLDDAEPGWSFEVRNLGDDWALGRLTLADGRYFENIGYAENADTSWKKEILKDAVSDAFKRCAALAGVARYLYDKDTPTTHAGPGSSSPRPAASPAPRSTVPLPSAGAVPEEPEYLREAIEPPRQLRTPRDAEAHEDGAFCPTHGLAWTLRPGGISKASGKPYDPFYACPSTEMPYCKQRPSKRWLALQEVA